MSKKWVTLCLAGCFGVMLGIAGVNSSSAYAAEGKNWLWKVQFSTLKLHHH